MRISLLAIAQVEGALDALGLALADKGHVWTVGERRVYQQARRRLAEMQRVVLEELAAKNAARKDEDAA